MYGEAREDGCEKLLPPSTLYSYDISSLKHRSERLFTFLEVWCRLYTQDFKIWLQTNYQISSPAFPLPTLLGGAWWSWHSMLPYVIGQSFKSVGVHNLPAERRLNIIFIPQFWRVFLFLDFWNVELRYRAISRCIRMTGRKGDGEKGSLNHVLEPGLKRVNIHRAWSESKWRKQKWDWGKMDEGERILR